MDRTGSAFKYLDGKFSLPSDANIKEGVSVCPQIRTLFRDVIFNNLLQDKERKKTWNAFRLVSTNFLGNIRAENYKELIDNMLLFTNLQNVIKHTNFSFPLGFLPRQLLHGW
jgi:hypothetical protein